MNGESPMSDPREALVALILERFRAAETYMDLPRQAGLLADAILAAGWTPPGERAKPSVEDVARALFERAVKAGDAIPHRSVFEADARAVLALFPGRTEAEVKAEAWDEGYTAGNAVRFAGHPTPRRDANPYRAVVGPSGQEGS